jgi:hypothetical protein
MSLSSHILSRVSSPAFWVPGTQDLGVSQMIMDMQDNIYGCMTTSFKHF